MSPDELKQARKALSCSVKELAAAIEVEPATIVAWERGDRFPTKRYVDRIARLLELPPAQLATQLRRQAAAPLPTQHRTRSEASTATKSSQGSGPFEVLRDPDVWMIIRKVLAHPQLRAEVAKLCDAYEEP